MTHNFFQLNELLSNLLKANEPFSLLRIDNTAGYVMDCLHKNTVPLREFYNNDSLVEGGVFPNTLDYAYDVVIPSNLEAMTHCDILGFVDLSGEVEKNTAFTNLFGDKPKFYGADSFLVLDPCALLNADGAHQLETPWPTYLKDKKVLVVSTHAETIKHQWKNIDNIWGWNKNKIAPFELVDVIKSPYHPIMDPNQYPGCNTWKDTVEYIKAKIDTYDYDVLIAGSTTSSPMYAEHAKQQGKVGITFEDDTRVQVNENSRLVIDDFVYDPKTKAGKLGAKIALGTVRYASGQIAKNSPQNVALNTPTATISVRGTDFTASVDELGQSTVILLPSCPTDRKTRTVKDIEVNCKTRSELTS
jgi:hypothetical protein